MACVTMEYEEILGCVACVNLVDLVVQYKCIMYFRIPNNTYLHT